MLTADQANGIAKKFIEFLETGEAPEGLFADDVFCDLTVPQWRLQALGAKELVALRKANHPAPGAVPRWRCDPTVTGFVIEFEESWSDQGTDWYCREMARADVRGDSISFLSVYCTGDWDTAHCEEHRRTVKLLRP